MAVRAFTVNSYFILYWGKGLGSHSKSIQKIQWIGFEQFHSKIWSYFGMKLGVVWLSGLNLDTTPLEFQAIYSPSCISYFLPVTKLNEFCENLTMQDVKDVRQDKELFVFAAEFHACKSINFLIRCLIPCFIQSLCFLCIYWTENQVKKCHKCNGKEDSVPYFNHMNAMINLL